MVLLSDLFHYFILSYPDFVTCIIVSYEIKKLSTGTVRDTGFCNNGQWWQGGQMTTSILPVPVVWEKN